ncbi:Spc7 kinetochore protein [Rhizoctonia solani]|uniref:Spc7 kinetochore protein n=1 Tax=Rhizoctonia solani TaxID=456999 RepID=A0A8H7IMY1_9AGAM|nr:Spc7 kinetochore protein [Rhizoctonia solani]
MGSWNESSMDVMEFEIPRPTEDIVQGYSSTWDQHVMDIDYDVSQGLFLILDTNFLIKHLSLLDTVAKKVLEKGSRIPPLFFVLPGVVVDELDYQSKYGVRERAVAATNWLQDQIQIRLRTGQGVLRAQKEDETLRGGKSWRNLRGGFRLLSQDRNLSLKATISEIPTMSISKNMSTIDFLKEVLPGLRWDPPSAPATRTDVFFCFTLGRASITSRSTPRVVVPEPSLNLSTHDVIHDNDIDMDDISRSPMAYSPYPPSKHEPVYAQIYEDPLENLVGNLRRNGVLSRAVGPTSCPYPESPRQALSGYLNLFRECVYFISERNEAGYRAGGIRMWSIGDIEEATSTLERLFHEMKKQDSDQDQDQVSARKALHPRDRAAYIILRTRRDGEIVDFNYKRQQAFNFHYTSHYAQAAINSSALWHQQRKRESEYRADGLSPRRRKRRSMVPRKSILKMHNDEEETMDMTTVVGGINSDMTMGRKSLARRVSFAAMAQDVRADSKLERHGIIPSHSSSPAAPHTSNDAPTPQKSPVSTRRANSVEAGEASMELDDESMEGGDSFGAGDDEPQEFDGGEGAGEDSMDLTDTYQIGTPSRRRSSAPLGPLPPLDRSIERHNHRAKEDSRTQESTSDKDNGEYLVKTGKSIVPRRKSEAWAELQSLTNAGGSDMDEDSTGSTMNSDTGGGFIPASQESSGNAGFSSQGTGFSSQGTYSVVSSQEGDIGLEDAISRLRAARQSMGAGAADMSIDDEDGQSSSSGDFEGGYDDDDRTMDVTAVTGGLRFTEDDDEDEEAEPESEKIPSEPSQPADKPPEPAPAFKFFSQPEAASRVEITTQALATNLPTFAIDPPPPPVPQTGAAPSAPFTFTFPSPSKPTEKPAAAPKPTATIPAFSFDITPSEVAPSSAEPAESTPSIGSMRSAPPSAGPSKLTPPADPQPVARSPITFEVSQSPIRAPPATWSPRNAPRPFEFKLGTPRRTSVSAPGANPALDATRRPIAELRPSYVNYGPSWGQALDHPAEPEPEVESEPIQLPTPESVQPPSPLLPQPSLPMREPSPAQPSRPRTPEPLPSPREASPDQLLLLLRKLEFRARCGRASQVPTISASEFLKMTRISFMDGLTVKRRSTIGLGILSRRKSGEKDPVAGVADYITAMTIGVPQLETYNYAAKELKEYISNGKKAIRILEEDLDANNPYLFKEYLASGEEDRRALEETLGGHKEAMRMRSKMSWYKWRHNFVTEMQATADRETELLQQVSSPQTNWHPAQLTEPIPSLREQHAKLKAQLAAERAAPQTWEAEGDKQALQDQIRVHQEKLDALHPTVEIVNLRAIAPMACCEARGKFIELRYDDHYRVQMDCVAFKPIPSGCRILVIPPKGKQTDEFPVLSELVLDLAQAMIRRIQNLNLKKDAGSSLDICVTFAMQSSVAGNEVPVTITRADCGFGFKATTRVRFPSAKGLTKITFIFQEQHIRDWGKQLNTLDVDVEVVFGKLDRNLLIDVIRERFSDAIIEESYGLLLDACADAIACTEEQ